MDKKTMCVGSTSAIVANKGLGWDSLNLLYIYIYLINNNLGVDCDLVGYGRSKMCGCWVVGSLDSRYQ